MLMSLVDERPMLAVAPSMSTNSRRSWLVGSSHVIFAMPSIWLLMTIPYTVPKQNRDKNDHSIPTPRPPEKHIGCMGILLYNLAGFVNRRGLLTPHEYSTGHGWDGLSRFACRAGSGGGRAYGSRAAPPQFAAGPD